MFSIPPIRIPHENRTQLPPSETRKTAPAPNAENSPEAAFAHALTIRDSTSRFIVLRQVSKRFLYECSNLEKALECIDLIQDAFDKGWALHAVNEFFLTPEHQNLKKALEFALQISHPLARSFAFSNLSKFFLTPEHQNLEKAFEFVLQISDCSTRCFALWRICEFCLNLAIPDPIKAFGYASFMQDDFEKSIAFSRLSTFCSEHDQLYLAIAMQDAANQLRNKDWQQFSSFSQTE